MAETSLPPSLAEMAGFLLAKAHALFHDRADQVLGPGELGIKHFGCLTVISDEGRLSVVDDLEAAGLVDRRRNPDDRRAYALEATDAGRAWIAEKRGALMAAQEQILSVLTEAEERQLVAILQRLLVREPAELFADPSVEARSR